MDRRGAEGGSRRDARGGLTPFTWTPAALGAASLRVWLRCDSRTLSGSDITQLTDRSGNGRHVTFGVGARPDLVVEQSIEAALFNGTSDLGINGSAVDINQPITQYFIVKPAGLGAERNLVAGATAAVSCRMFHTAANAWAIEAGTGTISGGTASAVRTALCGVYNGASSGIYANNFTTALATGNAGAENQRLLVIGSTTAGTNLWSGHVWEYALCSGAHDLATRRLFARYFAKRYPGLVIT